jgi:multisubunit Na+/H+ antiporter MnhF subunit
MNAWLLAAAVLLVLGVGPCTWIASRSATAVRKLIAVNLSGTLACSLLLLLAEGYGRTSYVDLALVAALLAPIGTLVFTRLLADLPRESDQAGEPR